jgi:phage terminase large subunit-like protein
MRLTRPTKRVIFLILALVLALGICADAAVRLRVEARRTEAPAVTEHVVDVYARDVVDGRIPAGKYHRLACERHLRDRARENTPGFPYRFDRAKAERFFRFASKLKHYKGEWAGQFIVLQPYQKFRLGSIFGWVHVETGLRRFRTAYNEIPRKNGKSLEAAIVSLYITFFDNEGGAEGYCLATKLRQAMFVFSDAKKLVASSGLKSRLTVHGKNIHDVATSSKLEPLGANPEDGLNPHFYVIDEFHKLKNRALIDVMETATGARRQPFAFQITTAGDDERSPCGEQHHYACQILDGALVDDTFFAFIAHADADDDWLDERTWAKANPNWNVSIKPDDMRALATKARHMPSAAAEFKQKRLNCWVNTDAPWLSIEGWRAGQTSWTPESMKGERCWVGVDLASKVDLAAVAFAFPPSETRTSWRYLVRCFTPADTLPERARRDRAPYQQWVDQGLLITNPGKRINYEKIREHVKAAKDELGFDIQMIGFDPWNANDLEKALQADGFPVVEVPQNYAQMSEPSKEFEAEVLEGIADAGSNASMAWMISNVVVQRDGKDNVYPVKKRSRGRIDGVVASLIGKRCTTLEPPDGGPSVYEQRGLATV